MIYPAIDVYENKCVRLIQGDFKKVKVYGEDPFEMAKNFSRRGFSWIHLVDLSGSKNGKFQLGSLIEKIKKETSLKIQVGGGIRSFDDAKRAIEGADRLLLGSVLFDSFDKKILSFGKKISFCLDGKMEGDDFRLYKNAWRVPSLTLKEFLSLWENDLPEFIFVTDIEKDGTLKGPNERLYEKLLLDYPKVSWGVSGGISHMDSIHRLRKKGVENFIVGKAIYEEKIKIEDLC